jgi:1-acyl-sn-glycerol-3-phosphate acyltransferase
VSLPPASDYVAPRPLAVWAFAHYFRRIAARHFASVRVASLSDPAAWDRRIPTLVIANHTTWWDGILGWLLSVDLGLAPHVLMEAVNLERYRAFKLIGTLPVRRDSLRGAYDDLMAARAYLREGTALWIFPQGQRRPALEPPVTLERGAAQLALAAVGELRICPVAFRYPFLSEQTPEAMLFMGEPWHLRPGAAGDRRALTAGFAERLAATVAELDARLAREALGAFRTLVPGRLSINKRMDLVRHRLGLLRGDFEARNG